MDLRIAFVLVAVAGCAPTIAAFQPDLGCVVKQSGKTALTCYGRAVAIAVHPNAPKRLFVASAGGGLFYSSDGGAHFTHVDALPSFSVVDVAYAPGAPDTVVATASADHRTGNGPIWRSTDGGASWTTRIVAPPTVGAGCKDPTSGYGLSFEPSTSNVYAGTDCGLAVSTDLGDSWSHVVADPGVPANGDLTQNQVWSVLAQSGGRVNFAASDGLWYRASATDGWHRATSGPSGAQKQVIHAFAADPDHAERLLHTGRPIAPKVLDDPALWRSIDGGATWTHDGSLPLIKNRPPFVRTARAPGVAGKFVAWVGDGKYLHFGTLPGPVTWTQTDIDHVDPADVGFDGSGAPILLVTDGGVHATSDGGATWRTSGGGPAGYNALQIVAVTGQQATGSKPHTDLYFGTQDNGIPASTDGGATWSGAVCCEGDYVRCATRTAAAAHSGDRVSGMSTGGGGPANFLSDPHFTDWPAQSTPGFPNAADGDSVPDDATTDGIPYPIKSGHYLQNTINDDVTPSVSKLKLCQDVAAAAPTWDEVATIDEVLRGPPAIVGDTSNLVVYQAVEVTGTVGTTTAPRIALRKITDLYATSHPAPTLIDNFGSLGVFQPVGWGAFVPFGVDPANPDHLIVADLDGGEMRRTFDGGQSWTSVPALTSLITGGGTSRFHLDGAPIVHAIAFDPDNSCHVLVGTAQNGIFRSTDHGNTWAAVAGSERIGNLSSFYFPTSGDIIVSSYGSGLWKLAVSRDGTCKPDIKPVQVGPGTVPIIHLPGRGPVPFKDLGDPSVCPGCQYLVASSGAIAEVKMDGPRVTSVLLLGGTLHQVDARRNEVPLTIPNGYSRAVRGGPGPLFAAVAKERVPIRGLVIEGDVLKGVITTRSELPFRPARVPYVRVRSSPRAADFTITVQGQGFAPAAAGGEPATVRVDGEVVAERVAVDERGVLVAKVPVRQPPGVYTVTVEQRDGKRLSVETRRFVVPQTGE